MGTSAPTSETPRYLQIAAEIAAQIERGELRAGDRVPSTRLIVERWGVAMATATKALTELRRSGLVRALPGVGTIVEGAVREPPPPAVLPPARRRGTPDGGLNAERVVEAGIRVADLEGLSALSMRRVAAEVGAATMSLYRHVEDKEDLVVRMLDVVFRAWHPPAAPPDAWRPRLELVARVFWGACREHPWIAPAISMTRPQAVAGLLPFSEFLLATLDRLGLDHQTTFTAYLALLNYVRGMGLNVEMEAEAEAATGIDNEAWMDEQEPRLRAILGSGDFPVFRAYVAQEYDFDLDGLFEFGLQRLLDGFEVLVDGRSPRD
ncbi:MAG: TetR/AcrR family transcriptional regulator C-terminal domain-containing protein [Candidatus Dormiibacterota bacterium]